MATSLASPDSFSEVRDSVTCNGYGECGRLLRIPDEANPQVRSDERGVETEESATARFLVDHRVTPRLHTYSSDGPETGFWGTKMGLLLGLWTQFQPTTRPTT